MIDEDQSVAAVEVPGGGGEEDDVHHKGDYQHVEGEDVAQVEGPEAVVALQLPVESVVPPGRPLIPPVQLLIGSVEGFRSSSAATFLIFFYSNWTSSGGEIGHQTSVGGGQLAGQRSVLQLDVPRRQCKAEEEGVDARRGQVDPQVDEGVPKQGPKRVGAVDSLADVQGDHRRVAQRNDRPHDGVVVEASQAAETVKGEVVGPF